MGPGQLRGLLGCKGGWGGEMGGVEDHCYWLAEAPSLFLAAMVSRTIS